MNIFYINKFHYLKGGAEKVYFETAHLLESYGYHYECWDNYLFIRGKGKDKKMDRD
jgi:hypothetical protein